MNPESVSCAVCEESLDHLTIEERATHYEIHLSEPGPSIHNPVISLSSHKSFESSTSKHSKPPSSKENVFWQPHQSSAPPWNITPALIPVLKRALKKTHARGITTRAVLARNGVCHIQHELFDGGWGCGYRNFLMACTALVAQQTQPVYFPLLDIANGSVSKDLEGKPKPLSGPGVRGLQAWIEQAWEQGYDKQGAAQLNYKLMGTRKWIGTADIYVAFTACGIPATLVDFPKPNKDDPPHGKIVSFINKSFNSSSRKAAAALKEHGTGASASALTMWILRYFDGDNVFSTNPVTQEASGTTNAPANAFTRLNNDAIIISDKMPIILQHQGHSRTIIGYEKTRTGINLLIFDPSKRASPSLRRAAYAQHLESRRRMQPNATPNPTPGLPPHPHSPKAVIQRIRTKLSHTTLGHPTTDNHKRGPSISPVPNAPKRTRGGEAVSPILIDSDNEDDMDFLEKAVPLGDEGDEGQDGEEIVFLGRSPAPGEQTISGATSKRGGNGSDRVMSEAHQLCDKLDPLETLKFVRVSMSTLSKHDEYQIIYFPLTEPLTDDQKDQRKVVRSETCDL